MPSTTFGFNPKVKARQYDLSRAKRLLAEAGHPNGFPLVLEVPVGRYFKGEEVADIVTAEWRQAGIDVKQVKTESGVFIQRWLAAKFEGVTFSAQNVAPGMDYQFQMTSFICSFPGKFMCDPQYEALYEQQKRTVDRRERLKLLYRMVERDFELTPSIPLFIVPGIHALVPQIEGVVVSADNHLDLRKARLK
jgi:peptide/nickel transport system substrate-binding protein